MFKIFLFSFYSLLAVNSFAGREKILVTIAPHQTFIEKIAPGQFEVLCIVPEAANPHTFDPTFTQIGAMAKANIWFQTHEDFETKLEPSLVEKNPRLICLDLTENIQNASIHGHCPSCGGQDRHLWMDPQIAKQQARQIERQLSLMFPEKAPFFKKNYEKLALDLDVLDERIRTALLPKNKRALLVSHPAFGYFCRRYQLQQFSVEQEGKDPRPKHLQEILKKTQLIGLTVLSESHDNKGALLIAERYKLPLYTCNPYAADYFSMLLSLMQAIQEAKE